MYIECIKSRYTDYIVNQTATSALAAVLNAQVLNNLTSRYSLAVSQTNTGVSLLDLLLPIIILIVVFLVVGPLTVWALRPFLGQIGLFIGIVLVIAVVVFIALLFTGSITIPGVKVPTSQTSQVLGSGSGGAVLPSTNNPAGFILVTPGTGYSTGQAICTYDLANHQNTSCPGYTSPPTTASTTAPSTTAASTAPMTQDSHMLINITSVNSQGGITGYSLNYGGSGYSEGVIVTVLGGNNDATFKIMAVTGTSNTGSGTNVNVSTNNVVNVT